VIEDWLSKGRVEYGSGDEERSRTTRKITSGKGEVHYKKKNPVQWFLSGAVGENGARGEMKLKLSCRY